MTANPRRRVAGRRAGPEWAPPHDWVLDPDRPVSFSALPESREYAAFQRNVADALDESRGLIERIASEFTEHFERRKVGALDVSGNPDADTALVTIGTIGESAQELLETDDDLLVVRVHAYRPFPAEQLSSVLAHVSRVAVVDRAPAFGSLGPLGADVRSLGLRHVEKVTNVVCGLGGTDVTPDTLRWILGEARSADVRRERLGPVYVPEGV